MRRYPTEEPLPGGRRRAGYLRALLETAALYGLLAWIYVAAFAATDPGDLDHWVTRWLPLRIDTAGTIAFAVSVASFLLLNLYPSDTGERRGWGGR
ncbi:hypothetical protein [Pseudonocardia asaccharolytica]|uniref:Uncharacterized protein n=1 Tax=Pseudonocardia asaccharolytica DSM 44247 = NBRC 16224 TaxID=1123024 RepID=A0A511CWE9_9PSEU|nr:hypothetical protein [Pseudonocardia asaccharolytica]GEL16905.1 hypothetical protein PA7_07420 [Pseudonocardia asaccharolytica DSM 44247 = NBRC 16224]